jgi:hypothetical protein
VAPQPKPKPSKRGLGSRLSAKVGPLPVWAWAAVILGAYLLYTRLHPATATSDTTATPDTSGDSGAQSPSSGMGGSGDNMSQALFDSLSANTSSVDALTSQLLSQPTPYSEFGDSPLAGYPTGDTSQGSGPASQPTTQPTPATPAAAPAAAPAGHPTQTTAGKLSWGGLTFTTKAAFDNWARTHGTTTAKELSNHPQAKAIYSTLK